MSEEKNSVLFLCVHNSARSQIAEELLKKYGKGNFHVESAGSDPKTINPYAVKVLKEEEDIDIFGKKTVNAIDLYEQGKEFHYIITVCKRQEEIGCPTFPGVSERLSWPYPDPEDFKGTDEEITLQVKDLYNDMKKKVLEFIDVIKY